MIITQSEGPASAHLAPFLHCHVIALPRVAYFKYQVVGVKRKNGRRCGEGPGL